MKPVIISLLTDFGLKDGYVASMKGVILGMCPDARLVDISHMIPPQDIRSGAFLLGSVYRDFPPGTIHLAVVDPGVGTIRRGLVIKAGSHSFVGPDNGLFSWVLGKEPVWSARSLDEPGYWRREVSMTFHGRDVFAPVAAHLANGIDMAALGPECAPLRAPWGFPQENENELFGEVVYVDHFGNAITNLTGEYLNRFAPADRWVVDIAAHSIPGVVQAYGMGPAGAVMALMGSSGHLEIAINQGNAAGALGICPGTPVIVRRRELPPVSS